MARLAEHGRRRLWPAALVLSGVGLLAASGVLAARDPTDPAALPPRSAEPRQVADAAARAPSSRPVQRSSAGPNAQKPNPIWITIPSIEVSAPVIPLRRNPDRTLEVPKNFGEAGWFVYGPEPGERGGAVIAGHVDSKSGPAVFYRLRQLLRGDVINVALKDRSNVRFIVTSTMSVSKDRFPTKLVYSKGHYPEIRLITCGGTFDEATGHYRDNYIVFARLATRRL